MNVAAALALATIDAREARLLLAATMGIGIANVIANPQRPLDETAAARFRAAVARRAAGEPVAYILGRREFRDLVLEVSPAVLIPRPETELLVELALARKPKTVLDLGTGSGAVALAIKHVLPGSRVVAVDASAAALEVARRNAAAHALEVEFRHGNWFEPVIGERFEAVVANPPYVAEGDPHLRRGDLRFEPPGALVSGADGLDAIRAIAAAVTQCLAPGGWLLTEHGVAQDAQVRALLAARGLAEIQSWPDLAGIARVTGGRLKSY